MLQKSWIEIAISSPTSCSEKPHFTEPGHDFWWEQMKSRSPKLFLKESSAPVIDQWKHDGLDGWANEINRKRHYRYINNPADHYADTNVHREITGEVDCQLGWHNMDIVCFLKHPSNSSHRKLELSRTSPRNKNRRYWFSKIFSMYSEGSEQGFLAKTLG